MRPLYFLCDIIKLYLSELENYFTKKLGQYLKINYSRNIVKFY